MTGRSESEIREKIREISTRLGAVEAQILKELSVTPFPARKRRQAGCIFLESERRIHQKALETLRWFLHE